MLNDSDEFVSRQSVNPIKTTLGKWNKDKDAFDDHLLRLVFERPALFNYSLPFEERSLSICNKLWKEVADQLMPIYGPLELERIKNRYKYYRNRYTRYRSALIKLKNGSSSFVSSKIYAPKHIEILCKIDALGKDSETNLIFTNIRTNDVVTKVCRTCLIEKSGMESIFSMQLVNNQFVNISTMISMCTGLEFSEYDDFSNVICDSCINAVSLAFEFRIKCWNSHKFLMHEVLQKYSPVLETKSTPPKPVKKLEFLMRHDVLESKQVVETKPILVSPDIVLMQHVLQESKQIVKPKSVKKRNIAQFINKSGIFDKLKEYADITLDETVYRGKRYKCRHCEQKYLAAHLMIDHLENIHKFSIKPDTWTNPRRYDNKKIICQQCGVSVPKGRFAEHFRRHTGEKPFKCDSCDFRAAQISSLSKHKLTHTGEKPAICHVCSRAFRTASHRAVHMRSHSDETPFKCIICKRGFKFNEFLKRHMQTHEPSKMYECQICNRKFSQKGPQRVHMMQHTGRRPHKCSECGKGFIQRHCWRTHMKNHHKITVQ